jgi:hypothetical protein
MLDTPAILNDMLSCSDGAGKSEGHWVVVHTHLGLFVDREDVVFRLPTEEAELAVMLQELGYSSDNVVVTIGELKVAKKSNKHTSNAFRYKRIPEPDADTSVPR